MNLSFIVLQGLRSQMNCPTSLVVVGGADDLVGGSISSRIHHNYQIFCSLEFAIEVCYNYGRF